MERREFFSLLGVGTAGIFMGNVLTHCTKDSSITAANADFTIDLNDQTYAALKNSGGYIYQNDIVIIHTNAGQYLAVSDVCTHMGCTVEYNGNNGFQCPCHGAQYALDGSVLRGPATRPLKKYNTSLNGTMLRVYS